jgi:hypothetical protein
MAKPDCTDWFPDNGSSHISRAAETENCDTETQLSFEWHLFVMMKRVLVVLVEWWKQG